MEFNEVYSAFLELKEILIKKKEAIIKKDINKLAQMDEATIVIVEKINKYKLEENNFSQNQKDDLKKLGEEIKKLQENNEILIKHSLDVINNILSGILNIAQNDKCSYNAQGKGTSDNESLNISSIMEEA